MLSVNLSWRRTQLASENLDEKSDQSKTTYIMSVTKLAQYTAQVSHVSITQLSKSNKSIFAPQ